MSADGVLTGSLLAALGNRIAEAIDEAVARGMDLDEAVCVVAAVAADYGRETYGSAYLKQLAAVVLQRKKGGRIIR